MRKTDIEKKLRTIISNSVPDVLDNILIKCEEKKGLEDNMKVMEKEIKKDKKIKNLFIPKLVGAIAMAMVCIIGVLGYNQYNEYYTIDSVVEFDVNPSIELEINKKEKVINVKPLNDEGTKIIGDMDLKNTDLDVAVNALVGSMLKNGYISVDTNSILVSVKNDDADKASKLQEEIATEIDTLLKASSIDGSILTQTYNNDNDVQKISQENNVSEGKAKLINEILKSEVKDYNGNTITSEDLSKLSINELNLLVTSKQTQLENVNTIGTASEKSYIGKEKAKEIAYSNANVAADGVTRVETELDYDDGILVYEVDFYANNVEYEYEIDAKTGNILKAEKDDDNRGNKNSTTSSTTTTNASTNTSNSKETNNTSTNTSNSKVNTNTDSNKTTTDNSTSQNNASETSYIGKEKAKEIAFENAKVSSNEATRVEVESDFDDRKPVYEINFHVGNIEYEYEIDAKSGAILKAEKDIDD